ncbi:Rieske (2Fe-2S) protein [Streptomyces sp. JJ38]|uniref:Rieske (2Fe-2S) protein n=1 Tax=Streptomyces sp. JJ38 TaxID=2738128 RepID=UPI001C5941A3|nr:Rieske (2Fe-2S) protein [Streptomyces sp. JJ38]MBW1599813.1 Rieske (2Fe-2S) protein [Streptomyces sp. JJ38]
MTAPVTSRRALLAATGAAGLTTALVACGGSDGSGGSEPGEAPSNASGTPGQEESALAPDGEELAATSTIPEGGGTVFRDQEVVVTQPRSGEFKAYSAVCTHRGCLVGGVESGTINCPCHESRFAIEDGSVESGPARRPLPERRITVFGDSIHLA